MKSLPQEEYAREIEELRVDPDVVLSRAEQRSKYRERQLLYALRWHKKRGAELREMGRTVDDYRGKCAEMEKEIVETEAAIYEAENH